MPRQSELDLRDAVLVFGVKGSWEVIAGLRNSEKYRGREEPKSLPAVWGPKYRICITSYLPKQKI